MKSYHRVIRFRFYNVCNKTFLTLIILYFLTLSTNRRLTRLQKQGLIFKILWNFLHFPNSW